MAKHKITLLPGDGIGPEVTAAVVQIIECAGVDVEWEKYFVGAEALARFGDPLPQDVLDSIHAQPRGAQGTGHDADRDRLRIDQRPPAQDARPLREPPPREVDAEHHHPL